MFDPQAIYDVAVVGGGLCGFAAARVFGRLGVRVALVERRPALGWEITWALQRHLAKIPASEWLLARLEALGAARGPLVDAPAVELLLDREAEVLGLDVLLYAQPVALAVEDGRVAGLVIGTKSGEMVVRARAFLDATENALLWRLAGSEAAEGETAARLAVVFNGARDLDLAEPVGLGCLAGHSCRLLPSLWPGESVLEFEFEGGGISAARLALPDVLREFRQARPQFDAALVTAVGVEPFPLGVAKVAIEGHRHPNLANLFGGGPWASGAQGESDPADRLAIGEKAGRVAAAALPALPAPEPGAPLPHSRVAPPVHDADVVVCGGGTGGAFAAVAAARQGARTVVLEASTCLGGVGTGGGIHTYYHGVEGGIQDEADARLEEVAPLFGPPGKVSGFHPEAKKVVLEQMAAEAGVDVRYSTIVTGVQTREVPTSLPAKEGEATARRVTAVVAAGPDGNALWRGKAFVDATGDGDVAAMAGAAFIFGREADGLPHAYSLGAGRLSEDGKLLITNFDAGYCDPTDAVDLTRARRRALAHYWRDRFEADNRLLYVAPILGIRNSRLILGDYVITLADEMAGRQFPDVVAYAYSHFDNHGFDYENESDEAMVWVWLLGNWGRRIGCEVPYRALLPRGVEGLVMACRALSMTHDAHNQLRMQRDLQRVGEAAGVAAALAARKGVAPRQVPVEEIQRVLLSSGALGPRERRELPEPGAEAAVHDPSWLPPQPPALPLAERAAQLGTEKSQEATWALIKAGAEALPLLVQAVRAEKPATRFWASVALAMLGRQEAAPELRSALAERRGEVPEGRKTAPLWKSAICLLGRIRDREAVPELCRVLEDPEADLDALVAALRALGRIGDPAAVEAIERMLERDDLPTVREFQVSVAGVGPVREDARWQLDLAAAEALARCGKPRPDIARRHLGDERALVRRHARRVVELSGQDG